MSGTNKLFQEFFPALSWILAFQKTSSIEQRYARAAIKELNLNLERIQIHGEQKICFRLKEKEKKSNVAENIISFEISDFCPNVTSLLQKLERGKQGNAEDFIMASKQWYARLPDVHVAVDDYSHDASGPGDTKELYDNHASSQRTPHSQQHPQQSGTALSNTTRPTQTNVDDAKEMERLRRKVDELETRLSSLAGERLREGNANIADLSDANRPTKIAEKFSELYTNEWMNAFSELQDHLKKTEDDIVIILRRIIMEAYKYSAQQAEDQLTNMEGLLKQNIINIEGTQIPIPNDVNSKKILDSGKKHLYQYRKDVAPVSLVSVCKEFRRNEYISKMMVGTDTERYADKCVELTWLMRVQNPPLVLDCPPDRGPNGQPVPFLTQHFNAYTQKGSYIKFVTWPAVLLHEGGPLLSKGTIQGH